MGVADEEDGGGDGGADATDGVEHGEEACDDHEGRQDDSEDADGDVPSDFAEGDEGILEDEEEDPGDEEGSVNVDEGVGEFGANHAGEEVALGKAIDDDGEDEERHGGKEEVVAAEAECGLCKGRQVVLLLEGWVEVGNSVTPR